MRKFIFFLIIVIGCAVLSGCHSSARVIVTEQASHDTVFLNRVQYDSIYLDRWHEVERVSDTVHVLDRQVEYRYRLQHDTCYVHCVDTIPIVQQVEVVREGPRHRSWLDTLSLCCFGIVLSGFIILLLCLIKGLRSS